MNEKQYCAYAASNGSSTPIFNFQAPTLRAAKKTAQELLGNGFLGDTIYLTVAEYFVTVDGESIAKYGELISSCIIGCHGWTDKEVAA